MDYAFVPGTTPWELSCRAALESRPNTVVLPPLQSLPPSMIATVSNFIAEMKALPSGADNLILVGHGFLGDFFEVLLDEAHRARVGNEKPIALYEDLETADNTGTINALGALNPAGAIHLKGCGVGAQPKFLSAFKRALGGYVPVTAPKFFHIFSPVEKEREGIFEYFEIRYVVYRKTLGVNGNEPISSTNPGISAAQLVDEFHGKGFKLIDSTPIPKQWWEDFIGTSTTPSAPPVPGSVPKSVGRFKIDGEAPAPENATWFNFEPEDGPRKFYNLPLIITHGSAADYILDVEDFSTTYPTLVPLDNKYHEARPEDLEMLQQELLELRLFSLNPLQNPYPMWERYGEPDMNSWLTKRNWTTSYDKSDVMSIGGWRQTFTIRFPACRSRNKDGNFVVEKFNYYPATSGRAFASHLSEADSELFLTV